MSFHIWPGSLTERGGIVAAPVETGRPIFFPDLAIFSIDVFINCVYITIIDNARGHTQMVIRETRYTKRIQFGLVVALDAVGLVWTIGEVGKIDYGAICWTRQYGFTRLFRRRS